MFGFKKFFGDDLLQLAIMLSLLRVDLDSYLDLNSYYGSGSREIMLGSTSAYTQSHIHNLHNRLSGYAHPKSIDSILLNQQELFYELNILGRYNSRPVITREVTTYLLNEEETIPTSCDETPSESLPSDGSDDRSADESESTSSLASPSVESASTSTSVYSACSELSKEDMDLIEILLRQDIDLGVTREVFDAQLRREVEKTEESSQDNIKDPPEPENRVASNPWAGLNYTIDSETGEHVVQAEDGEASIPSDIGNPIDSAITEDDLLSLTADLQIIPLEESLDFESLDKSVTAEAPKAEESSNPSLEAPLASSPSVAPPAAEPQDSLTDQLDALEDMIQAAQLHMHPHGRTLQARAPYLRTVSMEQRWQDLANILSLPLSAEAELHNSLTMVHGPPPPHHNFTSPPNTSYGGIDNRSAILIHNASLAPPMSDINSNMSYHSDMADTSNLAAAVATSLSTMTNGSEPMGDGTSHGPYGADGSTTMLFPHNQTEMNQTTDGFLSSILNDEDLQLMDMAMNEVPYTPSDRYVQSSQHVQGFSAPKHSKAPKSDSYFVHPSPSTIHHHHHHHHHAMYPPMRSVQNDDAMDTSSDSAVSSMGSSERVPSISDGVHNHTCHSEWMETGSESSHPGGDHHRYYSMDYSGGSSIPTKYRPYEYSYATRSTMSSSNNTTVPPVLDRPVPPVAQKKYQLFGKRFPTDHTMAGGGMYSNSGRSPAMGHTHDAMKYPDYPFDRAQHDRSGRPLFEMVEGATAIDPPEHKFSCSMEFARQHNADRGLMHHVQHNHTYQLPSESITNPQRPTVRDKQKKKTTLEEHLSRDEKRARALKVPMNAEEIVNLPMDEFNERLSKFDLTEAQLALIRDIRRRGKNKVAAQNCRKRKLDQIVTLADVVQSLQQRKDQLMDDRQSMLTQRQRIKDKFSQLYRHVFQSLRDPDGNPYSPYEYCLQQAPNGSVMLVPRNSSSSLDIDPNSGAKAKKKDDQKK